MSSQVKSFI